MSFWLKCHVSAREATVHMEFQPVSVKGCVISKRRISLNLAHWALRSKGHAPEFWNTSKSRANVTMYSYVFALIAVLLTQAYIVSFRPSLFCIHLSKFSLILLADSKIIDQNYLAIALQGECLNWQGRTFNLLRSRWHPLRKMAQ